MFGNSELYAALNVTDITTTLDPRTKTDTKPALIADKVIPAAWTARKTINYYLNSPVRFSTEVVDYLYSANCRAESMLASQTIAYAVAKKLSRASTGEAYFKCVVNSTVPPQDTTDSYNTQVEITVYPVDINK